MERATHRNWHAVFTYIWNEKPIDESEADYILVQNDFVTLSKDQDSDFHKKVEDALRQLKSKRLKVRLMGPRACTNLTRAL
jgi:hypothetical protein